MIIKKPLQSILLLSYNVLGLVSDPLRSHRRTDCITTDNTDINTTGELFLSHCLFVSAKGQQVPLAAVCQVTDYDVIENKLNHSGSYEELGDI